MYSTTTEKHNLLSISFFCIFLLSILAFNANEFVNGYSLSVDPEPNVIFAYLIEGTYPNLNEPYVNDAHISIDERNYNSILSYNDIGKLNDLDETIGVYIYNVLSIEDFEKNIFNNEKAICAALPEVIYRNYLDQIPQSEVFSITEGTFPHDGTNEIVLSKSLLNEYGYTFNEHTIGSEIVVDHNVYTVVGITNYDFLWYGYQEQEFALFYKYSAESAADVFEDMIKYTIKMDYANPYYPYCMLIETKDGTEQRVLSQLIQEYPANNYISYHYSIGWKRWFNRSFLIKMIILNIIFTSLGGILIWMVDKISIIKDYMILKDYRNYFLFGNQPENLYIIVRVFVKVLCLACMLVINASIMSVYKESMLFLGVCGLMLIIVDAIAMIFLRG